MLDIMITHWNEPFEVGEKLFQMLNLQRGVDMRQVRVTVIHDGSDRFPAICFRGLRYPVRQEVIVHGGISAARNAAIELATEPWIMFCDFDDQFTNVYALRDLLSVLPCDGFDMLWTQILVEDRVDGNNLIYPSPERQRFVCVHGKLYNRQFLLDSGIRFNESMPFQEDSLFNATITARVDYHRIGQIKAPIIPYVWIRRKTSVTNSGRDDEAMYFHFLRNLKVTSENEDDPDKYAGMVTRTAYDTFYMARDRRRGAEIRKRILSEFVPWIRERKEHVGQVPEEILKQIVDVSRYELVEPGDDRPDDIGTVRAWIDKIIGKGD